MSQNGLSQRRRNRQNKTSQHIFPKDRPTRANLLLFSCRKACSPKCSPRYSLGGLRRPPGPVPRWSEIFAPPGSSKTMFFSLGPPQPLGLVPARALDAHGAQKRPGSLQALIWCPLGPFGGIFSLMFDAFPHLISRPFRLMFSLVFASWLVCALCFFRDSRASF